MFTASFYTYKIIPIAQSNIELLNVYGRRTFYNDNHSCVLIQRQKSDFVTYIVQLSFFFFYIYTEG